MVDPTNAEPSKPDAAVPPRPDEGRSLLERLAAERATPAAQRMRDIREGRIPDPDPWCAHHLRAARCVVCHPELAGRWWYVTGGGRSVHSRPDCEALTSGQEKVAGRGGTPEPIEAIPASARTARRPCHTCMGTTEPAQARPAPARATRARARQGCQHRWSAWRTGARGITQRECWVCHTVEHRGE